MPFFQKLELGNMYMYANALHLAICKFILVLENTSYKMSKNTRLKTLINKRNLRKASFVTKVLYCCTILLNSLISKDDKK